MKGDAPQERDGAAERYWRFRTRLELIKTGVWIVMKWIGFDGLFGPHRW